MKAWMRDSAAGGERQCLILAHAAEVEVGGLDDGTDVGIKG